MNGILRSFRKMRMNKGSGQDGHHQHRNYQQQPLQNVQAYQQTYSVQKSKYLKKTIRIIKKNMIKEKINRQMKILV